MKNKIQKKIQIRKHIAKLKKELKNAGLDQKFDLLQEIKRAKIEIKDLTNAPQDDIYEDRSAGIPLPNLGKLRLVLEKMLDEERVSIENDPAPSPEDLKRLALKAAVLDYYNDLECEPEMSVVDKGGDLTPRRDNQDEDETDFDFAPNKNKIYSIWMDKLKNLIMRNDKYKLDDVEYDESFEKGTPQGGAFEKLLDRYRKDFMEQLTKEQEASYGRNK